MENKNLQKVNISNEVLKNATIDVIKGFFINHVADKYGYNRETIRVRLLKRYPYIYKNIKNPYLKKILLTDKSLAGTCCIKIGVNVYTFDRKFENFIKTVKLRDNGNGYLATQYMGKTLYIHRIIMGIKDNRHIDHIDRNKHNNHLSNLRICTIKQNNGNKIHKGFLDTKRNLVKKFAVTLGGRKYFLTEKEAEDYYRKKHVEKYREFSPYFNEYANKYLNDLCDFS